MAISEAQRRAVAKYNAANYERLELRVEKGMKGRIRPTRPVTMRGV